MDKHYEAVKEILEDQIKKIAKKGDITPQELDSLWKASAVCLDFETKEAMKKAEEKQKQGGEQQQQSMGGGQSNEYSRRGSYAYAMGGGSNAGGSNAMMGGQSNHYPWFMYQNDGMSNEGNSYGPLWNQEMENKSLRELQSNESRNSGARGRGGRSRGNSNENSNASYENAYDGAYEGAYDGAYDSYENSNEGSYRRGRNERTGRYMSRESRESRESRGYSRAMDKERMIGKLEDMMDDAPTEKERRVLQQCVDKLERQ